MRFEPLLPGSWPLVIAVALVMAVLLWWSARWAFCALADPGARVSWWRRAGLALVTVCIEAAPEALPRNASARNGVSKLFEIGLEFADAF